MFGDIDKNKRPQKPQLFLCKPDFTTIGKLAEAYDINHTTRLADLSQLNFSIPYYIDIRNVLTENPNISSLRERYLVRVELGVQKEYYVITKINESSDSNGEIREVETYSLGYLLKDKMIRSYSQIGITARQAMIDALRDTVWDIGENLSSLTHYFNKGSDNGGSGGRTFEVSSKTVLDFVIEVATAFNAVIIWDTVDMIIDFELPENIGENRGLRISYGKYLQSIGKEVNTDEMVTRLTPIGESGLTIHSWNPTGSGYLEDLSYFIYPFKRDSLKNVIQSSYYMSDNLCHALLDYKDLVATKENEFRTLLSNKTNKEIELSNLNTQLFQLETDLIMIEDRIRTKKAFSTFHAHSLYADGSATSTIKPENHYGVLVLTKGGSINVTVNGVSKTPASGSWQLFGKVDNVDAVNISVTGITSGEVHIEIVDLTDDEFQGSFSTTDEFGNPITVTISDDEIVKKYSEPRQKALVESKEAEIEAKNAEIEIIQKEISNLQKILSVENNFTPQQIVERNQFIIEKEWSNDALTTASDLYNEGTKEFEKIRQPQMVINIDIVNFLEVIEEQRNWDKLRLGDVIAIAHERLKIEVSAKIIEIQYNYDDKKISLTIANIKDIKTDEDKLIDALYGSISTSTTVNSNKFKWDKVSKVEYEVDSILNEPWDVTKRKIQSAEGDVVWDRGGFRIINKNNPDEFLVATSGVLAITKSGGKVWEHAITTDGIIGERIIGKIIIGENLIMQNEGGSLTFDTTGLTIKDTALVITSSAGEESTIDQLFKDAYKYTDDAVASVQAEVDDVNASLADLNLELDGAYKDGILDESEKVSIKQHLDQLNSQKIDVDKRYDNIYNNTYLKDETGVTDKANLKNAKDLFNTKHTELTNAINVAITNTAPIDTERSNIASKFTAYQTALGDLSTKFESAINNIQKNKGKEVENSANSYADGLKTLIDQDINDVSKSVTDLNTYVDVSFHDGVIQESEAKAISSYTNALYAEKEDVDKRYGVVVGNPYLLTSTIKTNLTTAKTNYNNSHTTLINQINTAISDGKTTTAEKTTVDNAFADYKTKLGLLSDALEKAVDDIATNKAKEAEGNANDYTDTETADGKNAWSKFSGAGNSLPAGSVEFGNGVNNQTIEMATLNFNNRNDRNSTVPRNATIATDGTAVDHTMNTDGSCDISFEWTYDTTGLAGDMDGFIIYVYQGASSGAYTFGTSKSSEQVYYVTPEKRALLLYGVPANRYYTFGVQAYRIVDKDINASGVLSSSIVKSTVTGENPYQPSSTISFAGDITGTISGTSASTVKDKALGSLQTGVLYNNVKMDSAGFVATRSDNKARTVMNGTDGIKIQQSTDGGSTWSDRLYANTDGTLVVKNIIIDSGSITWANIGKPTYNSTELGSMGAIVPSSPQLTKIDANGVYTGTVTTDQLLAGTAKIGTALIESLEVGKNVTMGANASISWSQVGSKPFIPSTASDVGAMATSTYIDANGIFTGSIYADNIMGGTIRGVTIDVNTDASVGRTLNLGVGNISYSDFKINFGNVAYISCGMGGGSNDFNIHHSATTHSFSGDVTFYGNVEFSQPVYAKFK